MEYDWGLRGCVNAGPTLRLSQSELERPEVMEAVRAGDGKAIARVLDICLPFLRRLTAIRFGLSPEDAEDVLQEVRISFWRAARRFRGRCSLRTYLVQITRRRCIDHLRARERHAAGPLDEHRSAQQDDPGQQAAADRVALADALGQLTQRQRQILDLYYVQAMSYKEIAAEMDIVVGTVGAMKASALQSLRSALTDESRQGNAGEKDDG